MPSSAITHRIPPTIWALGLVSLALLAWRPR